MKEKKESIVFKSKEEIEEYAKKFGKELNDDEKREIKAGKKVHFRTKEELEKYLKEKYPEEFEKK